jgi:hypothetical protein
LGIQEPASDGGGKRRKGNIGNNQLRKGKTRRREGGKGGRHGKELNKRMTES